MMPLAVTAQKGYFDKSFNLPNHDNRFIRFGIFMGMNRSHFNFLHHNDFMAQDSIMTVESINNTGMNLAWMVNARLGEHFSIRTYPLNLIFTEKAFEYRLPNPSPFYGEEPLSKKKIQGISMSLPVQLKFQSDRIDNLRVYIMAGGKIEYDFAANKGKTNTERMFVMDKYDYGLEGGIGFHIYFPVFVLTPEIKLSYGLNNVHVRDATYKYSRVLNQVNSRSVTFSLTVE